MSTVAIKINGVDITAHVIIAEATFVSQVNGQQGQATFRVRDDNQTFNFTSGGTLTLDVDSVRVWGGYVFQAAKVFALPVINTTTPTSVKRIWEITGADYNILFSKRIVYKASAPTGILDFQYSADTYDDTIINDVFDHYLDISGDGLTRTGVQRISKAILDVPGKINTGSVASAGFTWGQMMDTVARATGGVYYIDPGKDLNYVDVETVDATYALTDTPTGAFDVGYQGFTLEENGSNMINDMIVWGAGTGSSKMVASRARDATSIADHGLWQSGLFTNGIFRQASADIVSHSYVYGTPQSHRGGKDDARTFGCRVFKPYFHVGQKVSVTIGIFGYTEVLPIRRITIGFINPTTAVFDLVLSHVIDLPNAIYEYLNIVIPGFVIAPIHAVIPPQPPPPAGCSDAICSITDAFDRSFSGVPGDHDVATCGLRYDIFGNGTSASVSSGILTLVTGGAHNLGYDLFGIKPTTDIYLTAQMTGGVGGPGTSGDTFFFGADTAPDFAEVDFSADGTVTLDTVAGSVSNSSIGFGPDTQFKMRLNADGVNARCKVWKATDPEPGSWLLTVAFNVATIVFDYDIYYGLYSTVSSVTATVENLVSAENTRCSVSVGNVDDFAGTSVPGSPAPGGWGMALSGGTWATSGFVATGTHGYFQRNEYPFGGDGAMNMPNVRGGTGIAILPYLPLPPISGDHVDVYTDLWIDPFHHPGGTCDVQFFVAAPDDIFTNITVIVECFGNSNSLINVVYQDHNGDSGGSDTFDLGSSFEGGWLRVHMRLEASGLSAVVWPRGGPEPGFQTVSDSGFTAQMLADLSGLVSLQVGYSVTIAHGSGSVFDPDEDYWVAVDNIELVHAGSPCYNTCPDLSLFDDFSRTVSPNSWGSAVSGPAYTRGPGVTNGSSYVSPGSGVLANAGGPFDIAENEEVDLGITPGSDFVVTFAVGLSSDTAIRFVSLVLDEASFIVGWDHDGGGNSEIFIEPGGGAPVAVPISNTFWASVNNVAIFKAQRKGGLLYFKLWDSDLAEPGWQLAIVDTGSHAPGTLDQILTGMVTSDTVGGQQVAVTEIRVGIACDPVLPVSAPSPSGKVCETITHVLGGTFWTTSWAFNALSLEVWVNGIARTDFTENPVLGQFTLSAAIGGADVLRVCYDAASTQTSGTIATFPGSGGSTLTDFLNMFSDMTIDVIEIESGTYTFATADLNYDRSTRPLTIRPVPGATVVFDGSSASGGQFYLGLGGAARYLYFEFAGVTFTNYTIGDTGIVWMGNASNIRFNGPTVHNLTVTGSGPIFTWALYLSIDGGISPTHITANNWHVTGVAQNFSACQVGHTGSVMNDITLRSWVVNSVSIALYASTDGTNLVMDSWVITNSVRDDRPYTVYFGNGLSGVYLNNHSDDGGLEQQGGMTNGGGNIGL